MKYVASLQDSHDEFLIESDYDAWLHFNGDIYDGKFLIDYIDRSYLPRSTYKFTIGDQLISVDGVAVADLLTQFAPYAVNASSNPVSRARIAAATITERLQAYYPRATSIGENATLVVKQADGTTASYTIPWDVFGTAVTGEGPVQSPKSIMASSSSDAGAARRHQTLLARKGIDLALAHGQPQRAVNPWGIWRGARAHVDEPMARYMAPLKRLRNMRAQTMPVVGSGLFPFDNPFPVFDPPAGFKLRLGADASDEFLSGTFPVGTHTRRFHTDSVAWIRSASLMR